MSLSRLLLFVMLLSYAVYQVDAHGWMSNPKPRGQFRQLVGSNPLPKRMDWEEYQPTANSDPLDTDFVCRGDPAIPQKERTVTYVAGQTYDISISFVESARHVGDCFFYITYDGAEYPNYSNMKWFKIYEQAQCANKSATSDVKRVTFPSWLKSGKNVILRWEWYALQNMNQGRGFIEYFTQCVDVEISGSSTPQEPSSTFQIPGHLPRLDASNYWDPYNSPYRGEAHFFTGPKMVTPSGSVPSTNAPTRLPGTGSTTRPTNPPTPVTNAPTTRPTNPPTPVTNAPTTRPTTAPSSTKAPQGPCRPKRSSVAIN